MEGHKKNSEVLLGDAFFNEKRWDDEAYYYDLMNQMEAHTTELELVQIQLEPTDSVLDIGCGPGRMTVPIAKKVREVYAMDFSKNMVEICRKNCETANITNVHCIKADWQNKEDMNLFPEVDVVLQARWSGGSSSLEKYRKVAKRLVVIIEWAKNPPRIARDTMFRNCFSEAAMERYPELRPFDKQDAYSIANETKNVKESRDRSLRKELEDNGIKLYSKIIEEGWKMSCGSYEEAISKLICLTKHSELVILEQFKKNLKPYLVQDGDLWRFYMPTWSKVEWFYLN